jgi:hypothetical protein
MAAWQIYPALLDFILESAADRTELPKRVLRSSDLQIAKRTCPAQSPRGTSYLDLRIVSVFAR